MSARGMMARAASGPRFDLRFERGQARLRLGQPVLGEGFRLEQLVSVIDVRGPTDVSAGAKRFRHHRARLVEARLRIDPKHVASRVEAGLRLRVAGDPSGLRLSLRDEIGVIELLGALRVDGPDVVVDPTSLAWVRGAPRGAAERLARLVAPFGVRVERERLRIARPLRALLAEVLLPSGWRVPDERACELSIGSDDGTWWIEAKAPNLAAPPAEIRRSEPRPRRDFDVLAADEPTGPAGRFREAMEAYDLGVAREAWVALGGGWLGAEAALELADRFEHALSPDELGDALLVGLASVPHDEALWRRWMTRLSEGGATAALRLADMALSSPLPRATRAALAVTAANGVLDAFGDPTVTDDPSVDARLRRVILEAAALAPDRPDVSAARAALAHREGRIDEAARLWEQAADALTSEDRREAAEWRRRAAQLVLGVEGPSAAERLFRRALEDDRESASILVELAGVLAERGDAVGAEEHYARLLRIPDDMEGERRAALLVAARHHLERGAPDRARPFLAELGGDSLSLELYDVPGSPASSSGSSDPSSPSGSSQSGSSPHVSSSERSPVASSERPTPERPPRRLASVPPVREPSRDASAGLESGEVDLDRFDDALEDDFDEDADFDDPDFDADMEDGFDDRSQVLYAAPETSVVISPGDADGGRRDEGSGEVPLGDEGDDADDDLVLSSSSPAEPRDPSRREEGASHLDSWLPGPFERSTLELPPLEPPRPITPTSNGERLRRTPPPVTLVSVADDELRALLEAAAETDEPAGVLEGALEEALSDADPAGIRRVLRVLERVDDFPGAGSLADRARRLLERLDEDD